MSSPTNKFSENIWTQNGAGANAYEGREQAALIAWSNLLVIHYSLHNQALEKILMFRKKKCCAERI